MHRIKRYECLVPFKYWRKGSVWVEVRNGDEVAYYTKGDTMTGGGILSKVDIDGYYARFFREIKDDKGQTYELMEEYMVYPPKWSVPKGTRETESYWIDLIIFAEKGICERGKNRFKKVEIDDPTFLPHCPI